MGSATPAAARTTTSTCVPRRSGPARGCLASRCTRRPDCRRATWSSDRMTPAAARCSRRAGARYEDRPLACRTYDCRVYAATGVAPDRADIAAQVRRWKFVYPTQEDPRGRRRCSRRRVHPRAPREPGERRRAAAADPRRHAGRSRPRAVPRGRRRGRPAGDPSESGTGRWPSATPTSGCSATVDAPRPPAYPVGQSPAPAGKSRPERGRDGQRAFHPRARHGRPASSSHRHLSAG